MIKTVSLLLGIDTVAECMMMCSTFNDCSAGVFDGEDAICKIYTDSVVTEHGTGNLVHFVKEVSEKEKVWASA